MTKIETTKPNKLSNSETNEKLWVSVGAAIYDDKIDSFVLIQREDNELWELPGGLVEPGEGLIEATVREVLEETGIHVEVTRPTGIYESPNHEVISIVFACNYLKGELQTSNETIAVEWVRSTEIGSLVNEAYSCRLLDSLSSIFKLRTTDEVSIVNR